MKPDRADVIFVTGFTAFAGGLWMVSPSAALIAAGLVLMALGLSLAFRSK